MSQYNIDMQSASSAFSPADIPLSADQVPPTISWPYAFPPIYPTPIDPSYYVAMLPVHDRKRLHSDYTQEADSREAKRLKAESRERQEGDWVCQKCGNINWPSRTKCNMKKCGAPKPADVGHENVLDGDGTGAGEGSGPVEGTANENYAAVNGYENGNDYDNGENYGGDGTHEYTEANGYGDGGHGYDGSDGNGYVNNYAYGNGDGAGTGSVANTITSVQVEQHRPTEIIAATTETTTTSGPTQEKS